ncbi:MAG TPA: hypothetical protein VLM89_01945 [Phycisphaerae bacterium]|nr:hypothetical protein [Phycisphaerae bacterium]
MARRAYTLLEVLLVIGLLGLIGLILLPNLGDEIWRRSLIESADRLRSLIVMTHAGAVHDGVKYRIQFPGTADPNDRDARKEIDIPIETLQPQVYRQSDALRYPEAFEEVELPFGGAAVLQPGTRCVAVLPGRPSFDVEGSGPIAGPSIGEGQQTFVPLALHPDGTSEWVTFVLTDLPYDTQLEWEHAARILNVIVDGRTGQVWVQRALRREEVKLMQEKGASPILHVDFTSADEITEDNLLKIQFRSTGVSGGSGGGSGDGTTAP